MSWIRGTKYMHLTGATNNTPCIPGDGRGSRLNRVTSATTVATPADAIDVHTQAKLTSPSFVEIRHMVIVASGFWGIVTDLVDQESERVTGTTDNAANQIDATGHGLANGTPVRLTEIDDPLPAPLSASTVYYVVNTAANDFQLALTPGGSAVNITGADVDVSFSVANVVTVDQWRDTGGHATRKHPEPGDAVSVFPSGSCIATAKSILLKRLIPTKSITAVAATHILDHRLATATPVLPYNSVVGVLTPIDLDIEVAGPVALVTSAIANFDCTLEFQING